MLRITRVLGKNPVNYKFGQGMISHQLKRLLQKKHLHRFQWDPLPMYPPRALVHANRKVDHATYQEQQDPHWDENVHWVPDQQYMRIPVPKEYKDAYWWRELQARRVQCPVEWVSHRMYNGRSRRTYDFQDLAFRRKHQLSYSETVENAKTMRS